jgi:hypothetical protein
MYQRLPHHAQRRRRTPSNWAARTAPSVPNGSCMSSPTAAPGSGRGRPGSDGSEAGEADALTASLISAEQLSSRAQRSSASTAEYNANLDDTCELVLSSAKLRLSFASAHPHLRAIKPAPVAQRHGWRKIVGEYQLKTGDGKPSCAAHLPGAAWLMAGDPPGQPRVRDDGWIKAGDAEMKSFLGASLFCAIPKLWLEPLSVVGQAAKRV